MTILIVHYHLRAGGVTRIVAAQVAALQNRGHRVVVASSGPRGDLDCEMINEPSLDYQRHGKVVARELFALCADLWIIHNPMLGKNAGYPELIEEAVRRGVRLLLQCHDFAEDGRPGNYALFHEIEHLYPLASHVHYALINRRDQRLLLEAGVPEKRCHYLPNAVVPPKRTLLEPKEPLVFYPVRGIRRKNLGELCLLAAHAPAGVKFAVALAPENRECRAIHDAWASFAKERNLPIEFDVARSNNFTDWLGRATHLVTTSVAEGFGLTFLEPAFLGLPLIGRNLPEITSDFPAYGSLYNSLPVSSDGLEEVFKSSLSRVWKTYGRPLDDEALVAAWKEMREQPDFGNLPEEEQGRIISRTPLPGLAAWLAEALAAIPTPVDLAPWTLEAYAERLEKMVLGTGDPGPVTWLDKDRVLDRFLKPDRFHFLRT